MRWPFRSRDEPKNNVPQAESPVEDVLLSVLLSGEQITRQQALSVPAVSAAVERVCNTVAVIPFRLYRETKNADGKRVVEAVDDRRVTLLNDDTGDTLDGFQFKKQLVQDYLLGKGGYAYINRRLNQVQSIHYVDESRVSIEIGTDPIFKRYAISVNGQRHEPFDFLKIIRSTKDGASGESLLSEVNTALQTAVEMLKYQIKMVKSGGNKKGFIKSQRQLSGEQFSALKAAWRKFTSADGDGVMILNNGLDFQESSNNSLEMQLNQSKVTLNNEIDSIFGIFDDEEKYFKYGILPIVRALETALNRDFLLETEKKDLFWAADSSEITKIDMKSRYEAYEIALRSHWITANEVRYRENMDALEGLDKIDLGLGAVLLDTKTGVYYVPNTGETVDMREVEEKQEGGDE